MKIIIHCGSQQIGGNCIELSTAKTRILLDVGKELPALDEPISLEKGLFPDVKALLNKNKVDGVLISHSHSDHIGLINKLNPDIPVYIGKHALHVYNTTAMFTCQEKLANPVFFLESAKQFKIGDFTITPYLVDHSGYDAYSFIIEANGKKIVYTGDFRDHGKKAGATEYFKKHLSSNIDALLIEGTMMNRRKETLVTEDEIEEKACALMQSTETPVLVLQSSTNIDRLVGMYRASKRSGRLFVIDIFTAQIVSQLGDTIPKPSSSFDDIRVIYPYWLTKKKYAQGCADLMNQYRRYKITKSELGGMKKYCLLFRPSMLSDLKYIDNLEDAQMIYSMWNGYKKQSAVKAVLAFAEQNKMPVTDLHTSGHASVAALENLIRISEAQIVLPIHTENAKAFWSISKRVRLPEDGKVITI